MKFGGLGIPATLLAYTQQYAVTPYLVLYNAVQTVGWGFVLAKALRKIRQRRHDLPPPPPPTPHAWLSVCIRMILVAWLTED